MPYADRAREKQRVRALVEQRAARESHPRGICDCLEEEGKAAEEEEALVTTERTKSEKRLTAAKRRQQEAREDFDDINDDYRALKKLKEENYRMTSLPLSSESKTQMG